MQYVKERNMGYQVVELHVLIQCIKFGKLILLSFCSILIVLLSAIVISIPVQSL